MASALIRAARTVSPVRAANASMVAGASARASKSPSSAATKRCFAAMKPDAIRITASGFGPSPPGSAARAVVGAEMVMVASGDRWDLHRRPRGTPPPSQISGPLSDPIRGYCRSVARDLERRTTDKVVRLVDAGQDWLGLIDGLSELINEVVPFSRTCWHSVDPGTVLFTGSVNRRVSCSGSWLAQYEYVVDDVNRWWFLARSDQHAGATGLATHGDLSRSARHRSREGYGTGDELRVSFVSDGVYWGAAGFLREEDDRFFDESDVRLLAELGPLLAAGVRRSLLVAPTQEHPALSPAPVW